MAPGAPPAGSQSLGAEPDNAPVGVEVVVAPANQAGLSTLLRDLYDPASPQYHHWLAPGQFAAEFGPSSSEIDGVMSWLSGKGVAGKRVSTFGIDVQSTAGALGHAFGTTFNRYRTPSGQTGYIASGAPVLPASLAGGEVTAILGLNSLIKEVPFMSTHPESRFAPSGGAAAAGAEQPDTSEPSPCSAASKAGGGNYYTMNQVGASYGIGSLLAGGQDGTGQTIGLYELTAHSSSDVSTYLSCFGLSNPVTTTAVDGGDTIDPGATPEADLDIEQAATQAPGASMISYEGPNTVQGAYDVWRQIVTDDKASVVSTSWGQCEADAVSSNLIGAFTGLFQQAATQGQTILAASGDDGTEGCYFSDYLAAAKPNLALGTAAEVTYPAFDDYATAVGGTFLWSNAPETAWNNCLYPTNQESITCANQNGGTGAGGAGLSGYEAELGYQPQVGSWPALGAPCGPDGALETNCREVPDISANSGAGMIFYSIDPNNPNQSAWYPGGGTSFAAPFMAGLIADKNVGCTSGSSGLLTPSLYALYNQGAYGTAFTDITQGNTDLTGTSGGLWPAASGYDLATGIGSPLAAGLSCPEVQSVSPSSAVAGSTVTVTGLGLETATIMFGNVAAHVLSATATAATVIVPANSGTQQVSATSQLGTGTVSSTFSYPRVVPPCPTTPGPHLPNAVGIASVNIDGCPGYFVSDGAGQVSAFGAATFHGDLSGTRLDAPIIAIEATPDGLGYWMLGADGGIFTFGDAHFYGSTGGIRLDAPVVGMAVTPTNGGYWLVAKDGGIFTFGDARFYGSTGGVKLTKPVDGMAVAPGGNGYWLVAQDGGVFTFTPDGFFGSLGGVRLAAPIVGMSSTPTGNGYTLVGSDGGVFAFGMAPFYGSLGGHPPASPIVDLSPAPADNGYYLVDSAGQVWAFGPGATFLGNA
jgi:subtilase family serine protease